MPWSCVRGARGRFRGVGAGTGCCVFPVSPFSPRFSCAVCGGLSRPAVPYPRSLVRHSMRSVRSAGWVRLPFWYSPRVLCVCVRSRSGGVRAPPPFWVGVARAPRAVPVLDAGRAVPRGPCPFACPAPVLCAVWLAWGGGRPGPVPPLPGLGLCAPLWAGPGGVRPGLWVQGVQACGPVTNPTTRALASWLCALWGRQEGARGGRPLPWCGASGLGRSPSPDRPSFGTCGRGPPATGCGCGGCGRGDPSPTPQRALLRAGFARCGGGTRAPWGGGLWPGCAASGIRRSPGPDRPSFGACGRGPIPTDCGRGGCGCGDPSPTPQHALLRAGFARRGGSTRAPGRGASGLGAEHPGSGALPAPTARPLGRAAGANHPLAVGTGDAGVGTCHQPHSARSCEPALRAVGAERGRRGWRLLPGCGASGIGRFPSPDRPSFEKCGRGPLPTGCGCGGLPA